MRVTTVVDGMLFECLQIVLFILVFSFLFLFLFFFFAFLVLILSPSFCFPSFSFGVFSCIKMTKSKNPGNQCATSVVDRAPYSAQTYMAGTSDRVYFDALGFEMM